MLKTLLNNTTKYILWSKSVISCSHRCYAAPPKRFYKDTNVLYGGDGQYEITLDNRKLKTPNGSPFIIKSEPLAIAVATEWDAQKEIIERSTMHLTSLCSTSIDNPNRLKTQDIVNYIINFLPTDTILFHSGDEDELYKAQCKEWDPIISWFNKRYETDVVKNRDLFSPVLSPGSKMTVSKHLLSYDLTALHGLVFAVDVLKSLILTFACIDRHITVEQAIKLSRLEEEYQVEHWGRVEWAHDLATQDLQARLAAAVLFVHLNTSQHLIKEKLVI